MATSIGKLNVTNIKSPLGGGKTPIHKLNFTSGLKVGSNKFAGTPAQLGDTAKFNISRIDDIISLEDRAKLSEQKISSLTRILSLQKKNKKKERDQLTEINDSLKDIGNALALDFANRITEEKQELNLGKDQIRKDKLSFKEKLLESGKRMGETIKKTTASITAPALGIFGRIFEFLKTVFTGALIDKSLKWLEKDGSVEKLKTFFDRIKENLPTFGRIAGAAGILYTLNKVAGLMTTMVLGAAGLKAGLLMFANPLTWKILAAVALGVLVWKSGNWITDQITGGGDFSKFDENLRRETKNIGLDVKNFNTGALVLGPDGKPITVKMLDLGYPSEYLRKNYLPQGATQDLNIIDDAHRLYIERTMGKQRLVELDAAYARYFDLMKQKDNIKDKMKEAMATAEREIRAARFSDSPEYKTRFLGEHIPLLNIGVDNSEYKAYQQETSKLVEAEKARIRELYSIQVRKLLDPTQRLTGGSFSSGIDYLVGENGPELARFNGHGTIERSGRTAQLLANKFGSGVNIVPFDLPTIKASAPKLSSNTKATVVNDIVTYSSVNIANPYMVEVPEIFGITV